MVSTFLSPSSADRATHSQQGGFATVTLLLAIGFVGLLLVRGGGRRI